MITDNLTNTVCFSALLPASCPNLYKNISAELKKRGIPCNFLWETKDIWCRDYMPIQMEPDRLVSYRYTPNYLQDKKYVRLQTDPEKVLHSKSNELFRILPASKLEEDVIFDGFRPIKRMKPVVDSIKVDLIIDGGNIVKCGDCIVMTEKVFVENKEKSCKEVERILHDTFQCDILFLPWDRKEYLGHSDGIVHYAGNGRVLLTNYIDFSIYYYRRFRKALESRFEVIPLQYKVNRKHARSWAYINFLQLGKLVFVPQLGIEEDEQAMEQIGKVLSDCEVIGIPALEAVRRGGALNCISWNVMS